MPPNLGGFFMVRSYYPSECHADYFDFERIEALKPAIEACGISTLFQSPMLFFLHPLVIRFSFMFVIPAFGLFCSYDSFFHYYLLAPLSTVFVTHLHIP